MQFESVEVLTRDEYKGAQDPVSFVWRGNEYRVEQVLDRWYEGGMMLLVYPMLYFRVRTVGG